MTETIAQPQPQSQPQAEAAYLDGNSLAGPLAEIFAAEATVFTSRCAGCGRSGALAELRVYDHAPGLVARCPGCDQVMLRLVSNARGSWLDLHGCLSVHIPPD
jgi:hypothetical protein